MLSKQDDTDGEVDVGDGDAAADPLRSDASDQDDDDNGDEKDDEYDASSKKSKSPYIELSNLLNTRLQKLITKAPKEYVICYALGKPLLKLIQPWGRADFGSIPRSTEQKRMAPILSVD